MTSFALNSSVLFLDVDGVLTMERCVTEEYEDSDNTLYFVHNLCPAITTHITPLEKSRVAILKTIVDHIPDLKIVISSTWRIDVNMYTFLLSALEAGGINTAHVVLGGTPHNRSSQSCRGSEILEWLNNYPEYRNNFVIVDDGHVASFMSCGLTERCVKTEMHGENSEQGLSQRAAERVLQLLATQHTLPPLPPVPSLTVSSSSSNTVPNTITSPAASHLSTLSQQPYSPVLILLCGIPGIGKDTLSDYVFQHYPSEFQWFQSFSQDQFANAYGSQKGLACRQAVAAALANGYSVILKRNNHTKRDRQAYVELAW